MRTIEGTDAAAGFRFALVVSRSNESVTSNRGWEAAVAAIEMVSVVAQLTTHDLSATGS
jgi:6,7-dimethyl-8-ribityllumazine synthase